MIVRHARSIVADLLGRFPVAALVGPRQVGKTTLARALVAGRIELFTRTWNDPPTPRGWRPRRLT